LLTCGAAPPCHWQCAELCIILNKRQVSEQVGGNTLKFKFVLLLALLVLLPAAFLYDATLTPPQVLYDVVIRGATIVDGSGGPSFRADVALVGEHIAKVGRVPIRSGKKEIRGAGYILTPGFVDIHSHVDLTIRAHPEALAALRQGVTTVLVGQDGRSRLNIGEYLAEIEALPNLGVNFATLLGHGLMRHSVVQLRSAITPAELATMSTMVTRAMEEGAFGLSSALEYWYNAPATVPELIALNTIVAAHGGVYITHVRDEAAQILPAIEEALAVARGSQVGTSITHFKVRFRENWHLQDLAINLITEARRAGLNVIADAYPYLAPDFSTSWPLRLHAHRDPRDLLLKRTTHPFGAKHLETTVSEIAAQEGLTPAQVIDNILRHDAAQGVNPRNETLVTGLLMSEENLRKVLSAPFTAIASDNSAPPITGSTATHPRGFGTFPRFIAKYVRDARLLTLEEGVRRMTGLPAAFIGLTDRGLIKEGYRADLVMFRLAEVEDKATFSRPEQFPLGINYVFVNGVPAVVAGEFTGNTGGQVLRRNRQDAPLP